MHGESVETLRALLPLIETKTDTKWRDGIEKGVKAWWELMEKRALAPAKPGEPPAHGVGTVAQARRQRHRHLAIPAPAPIGTPAT